MDFIFNSKLATYFYGINEAEDLERGGGGARDPSGARARRKQDEEGTDPSEL